MIAAMFVSMISFSQTIKENIEKVSKDPKTAENAAKADVYITGKRKIISNTTIVQASHISTWVAKKPRKKK